MGILLSLISSPRVMISVAIVLAITSGIVWFKYNSNRIKLLETERSQLELQVDVQKKAIDSLKKDMEKVIATKDSYLKEVVARKKETDSLKETLFRETQGKKGLEELARAKPKLVEGIINRAIKANFECINVVLRGEECQ